MNSMVNNIGQQQNNTDEMSQLMQNVYNKIGLKNDVEDKELIDHLERASVEIKELLSTSFGPWGLNKLITNHVGDVYLTNDGKTIIKEMDVLHPIVTSLNDLSKSMDRSCGDGTKTAVILASNLIINAIKLVRTGVHPTTIIKGYKIALNKVYELIEFNSITAKSYDETYAAILSASFAKGIELDQAKKLSTIVVDVIEHLTTISPDGYLDLEENVKIMKKVGGPDIVHLNGVILDETPARFDMPESVSNPNILILNYDLKVKSEFINSKRNISMDSIETAHMFNEENKKILDGFADKIINCNANVVFCEGDVDPQIESRLVKNNILMFKKLKNKDLESISKATGTQIMSIKDNLEPHYLGRANGVEVTKKCGEHFVFINVENQMISTILIWEPFKYALEKVEEAADDALNTAAFILKNKKLVTGGGGIEFVLSQMLKNYATTIKGKEQLAVIEYANALEEIPRILASNEGMNVIDSMVKMSNFYKKGLNPRIDTSRSVTENNPLVYDSASIKKLAVISATETATSVLRIDKILLKK